MNCEKVIEIVDSYLVDELKLKKINDDRLKNISNKCYFTDVEEKKYIICYTMFEDINQLIDKWEEYQDEDIALYLQSDKYRSNNIKWDIYYMLVNLGKNEISAEKWIAIEKDKFSCKKIYISTENEEEIIENLKQKLPTVKDYYPNNQLSAIDEKYFFECVCEELKLSKTTVSRYYEDTEMQRNIITELLKAMGGDRDNE